MIKQLALLAVPTLLCSAELKYLHSVEYRYDSNPTENSTEVGTHYPCIELRGKFTFSDSFPLYIRSQFSSESLVERRDPKDCDPLIDGGIGVALERKNVSYRGEISGGIFGEQNRFAFHNPAEKRDGLSITERTAAFQNDLLFSPRRFELGAKTTVRALQFGAIPTDSGLIAHGENCIHVELEPVFSYKPKLKKKLQLSSAETSAKFERRFALDSLESFGRISATVGAAVKLGRPTISETITLSRKLISGSKPHPFTGYTMQETTDQLAFSTELSIPVVADLHFRTGAKLRFRRSNDPSESYSRHTIFARIIWDSKTGKREQKKFNEEKI